MNSGKYVFYQIIEFINRYEFNKCVKCYNGDLGVRDLDCWNQFLQFLWLYKNEMIMRKNVLIIFIGLLLFISCKITQDKESYKITSIVYITDWGEKAVDRKGIRLYAIDSLGRTKPQKIKEVRVFYRNATYEANTLYIKLRWTLQPKISYRLIINDSLLYNISEFEIIKETVYTMLSKREFIYIKNYKVNNIKISSKHYGEQFLYIDKNLAISYKKE